MVGKVVSLRKSEYREKQQTLCSSLSVLCKRKPALMPAPLSLTGIYKAENREMRLWLLFNVHTNVKETHY
jgi:hypothetical protein